MKQKKPKIILASSSPRRKDIMERMGLEFEIVPSNYEEDMTLPMTPFDLAKHLALGKAEDVAKKFPGGIVVGADTIVVLGDEVLGKPHTNDMAKKMLKKLSGRKHQVVTGLAIIHKDGGTMINEAMATSVFFKVLDDEQVNDYINTGEPLDKAGAYAVQGLGGALIERVEGDYWNLVGLPSGRLAEHLKSFGVNTRGL